MSQEKSKNQFQAIFIGGGAASFFAAIQMAESAPKPLTICIIERGKELLQKVKISGGGRCNVTNIISDPNLLVKHYPRGEKALLGPFHQFNSSDTVRWFESKGVDIKAEQDGRMFPHSNTSSTIVECLLQQARKHHIQIITRTNILSLATNEDQGWTLNSEEEVYVCEQLFIGSGSNSRVWEMLKNLGLDIVQPVPSLFTFNIKHPIVRDLPGISVPNAEVLVLGTKLQSSGALLITHWGMSGPAVLRISAWGARVLHEMQYQFEIKVNWAPGQSCENFIQHQRGNHSKKTVQSTQMNLIPSRLWKHLVHQAEIDELVKWADLSKKQMLRLIASVHQCTFQVNGKSTFKEEFVTAGGVNLKEIDFKYFRSKKHPTLYMAGEVLDIDGITGGFNFQAAWTGGWLAGRAMAERTRKD